MRTMTVQQLERALVEISRTWEFAVMVRIYQGLHGVGLERAAEAWGEWCGLRAALEARWLLEVARIEAADAEHEREGRR